MPFIEGYTPRYSLDALVADEVVRLSTAEGRRARLQPEQADAVSRIAGGAVGAASALDSLGKGIVGMVATKAVRALLGRIPEPAIVIVAAVAANLAIAWSIVNHTLIGEMVQREAAAASAVMMRLVSYLGQFV